MKRAGFATALGFLVLSSGVAAAGTLTTFTDRGAFNASVGPTITDTFGDSFVFPISTGILNAGTNLTPANGAAILPGRVQPGVTYSTPVRSGNFFNIDANSGFADPFLDGGLGGRGLNPLTVSFDGPVLAFGFDTNQLMGSEFRVAILFQSGARFTGVSSIPASSGTVFFGFQSSQADILSVRILGSGGAFDFAVDNFSVARGGAVPEPATASLVALALAALALRRIGPKRAAAARG